MYPEGTDSHMNTTNLQDAANDQRHHVCTTTASFATSYTASVAIELLLVAISCFWDVYNMYHKYHNKHQISFVLAVCYDTHFLWYMACVYVHVCVYMYVCVYVIISQWDLTFKSMLPTRKWIGELIFTRRWFCKLEIRWEGIRVSKVVEEFKNAGPAIRRTLSLPMRSQVLVPISSVLVPVTATLVTGHEGQPPAARSGLVITNSMLQIPSCLGQFSKKRGMVGNIGVIGFDPHIFVYWVYICVGCSM